MTKPTLTPLTPQREELFRRILKIVKRRRGEFEAKMISEWEQEDLKLSTNNKTDGKEN